MIFLCNLILCSPFSLVCHTGDVRLATDFVKLRSGPMLSFFSTLRETIGTVENMGRLEYCSNGDWRLFCRDAFHPNDSTVACTQLGFDPIGNNHFCLSC